MNTGNSKSSYNIWKTIHLGALSAERLINQMKWSISGFQDLVGRNVALEIFLTNSFKMSITRSQIDLPLVMIPEEELGFKDGVEYQYPEVGRWADKNGLYLCSPEVGPQLFLQIDHDEKARGWLWVAMPSIDEAIFGIDHRIDPFRKRFVLHSTHYGKISAGNNTRYPHYWIFGLKPSINHELADFNLKLQLAQEILSRIPSWK